MEFYVLLLNITLTLTDTVLLITVIFSYQFVHWGVMIHLMLFN